MIKFELSETNEKNLHKKINFAETQIEALKKLKNDLINNKSYLLEESKNNNLLTYKCAKCCLTVNKLYSERFEEGNLNFFITESRNKLKADLKSLMIPSNDTLEKVEIQLNAVAGVGKTYGLADFVISSRMVNVESFEKFIVYHNFHQYGNRFSMEDIITELFCSIYPLIKKELMEKINSWKENRKIEVENNSLMHLVFECCRKRTSTERQIELIKRIINKLSETYPNKQIIFVLDQINEISKGEGRFWSEAFLNFINKFDESLLYVIYCASNNNEFNRNNILRTTQEETVMYF